MNLTYTGTRMEQDPLLAKARALARAAEKTTQILLQLDNKNYHPQITNIDNPNVSDQLPLSSPSNVSDQLPLSSPKDIGHFRASVIRGSTLVNTHDDIRIYIKRGDSIFIDGLEVKTALKGEWNSNRIELDCDYEGDTNFNAVITLMPNALGNVINSRKVKKSAVPVPSEDIHQAIAHLQVVNDLCMKLKKDDGEIKIKNVKAINDTKKRKKKPLRAAEDEDSEHLQDWMQSPPQPIQIGSSASISNGSTIRGKTESIKGKDSEPNAGNKTEVISQPSPTELGTLEDQNEENDPVRLVTELNMSRLRTEDPRDAAEKRVRQKLKDDHIKRLEIEREKENLRRAAIEANELKVNELKEKTLARVTMYKEELKRKEEDEKNRIALAMELKKEKEKELCTEEKRLKMVAVRREARNRLLSLQRADLLREQEREEFIQSQLQNIAKKFEVGTTPSTHSPRIGAAAPIHSTGSGKAAAAHDEGRGEEKSDKVSDKRYLKRPGAYLRRCFGRSEGNTQRKEETSALSRTGFLRSRGAASLS